MTIKIYCGLKLDMRSFKTRSKMLTSLWFTARSQKKSTLLHECFPTHIAYLLWVIHFEYSRHKVKKTKYRSRGCCHPVASHPPVSGGAEMSSALRVASAFHRKQSLDKI